MSSTRRPVRRLNHPASSTARSMSSSATTCAGCTGAGSATAPNGAGRRSGGGTTKRLQRLEALWRAWEHLRQDPALGMSVWWRDHADPHMAALLDPDGPFAGVEGEENVNRRGEPLLYQRARRRPVPRRQGREVTGRPAGERGCGLLRCAPVRGHAWATRRRPAGPLPGPAAGPDQGDWSFG